MYATFLKVNEYINEGGNCNIGKECKNPHANYRTDNGERNLQKIDFSPTSNHAKFNSIYKIATAIFFIDAINCRLH